MTGAMIKMETNGIADRPQDNSPLRSRSTESQTPISKAFRKCLQYFQHFVKKLYVNAAFDPGPSSWQDELGRLRVWGGNLSAHTNGVSSLDFRLRDSSHIRQNVLQLLYDLANIIAELFEIISPKNLPEEIEPMATWYRDGASETVFRQLYREVKGIINDLFQMAMLIRTPSNHSRLTEEQPTDIDVFEPFDLQHVRDKFPEADSVLAHRLGVALTRRRKYLKYQERHHAKLSKGLVNLEGAESLEPDHVSELSETVATTFRIEGSSTRDPRPVSETSFASTFLQEGNLSIPSAPRKAIKGPPFECPYCHYIIVIADQRAWVKHVFFDLKPYSCTVIDCRIPHKLYTSQHDWVNHLNNAHGENWLHSTDILEGAEGSVRGDDMVCPLCTSTIELGSRPDRHMARHMQELALFALPYEDDAKDSETEDEEQEYRSDYSNESVPPSEEREMSYLHQVRALRTNMPRANHVQLEYSVGEVLNVQDTTGEWWRARKINGQTGMGIHSSSWKVRL